MWNNRFISALLILALAAPAAAQDRPPAAADDAPEPLSAKALAECASRIQQLRQQSERLNDKADRFDQRRRILAEQRAALAQETVSVDDDGSGGRWARYNADAAAFNKDIKAFRKELAQVAEIKRRYDRQCANRPYRRSDLEALPEAARTAMKRGMGDVRVPFSGGAANDGSTPTAQ